MHINSISCGQGAPSIYLMVLSKMGVFSADVVIVADTGSENDMLWSTGERTTSLQFFNEVTKPLAEEFGMNAVFVRATDKNGHELPPLMSKQRIENGKVKIDIPLFGSNGGMLHRTCTSKYKVAPIRQALRRLGATTATSHLGYTMDEIERIRPNDVSWESLSFPMIMDKPTYRATAEEKLRQMGIPYLVRSQCNACPLQDLFRWEMQSDETISDIERMEKSFGGEYFFTRERLPIRQAIRSMKSRQSISMFNDSCGAGGPCGT